MNYFVFIWNDARYIEIAQTTYRTDADHIIKRWSVGYIVDSTGAMVFQKGMK